MNICSAPPLTPKTGNYISAFSTSIPSAAFSNAYCAEWSTPIPKNPFVLSAVEPRKRLQTAANAPLVKRKFFPRSVLKRARNISIRKSKIFVSASRTFPIIEYGRKSRKNRNYFTVIFIRSSRTLSVAQNAEKRMIYNQNVEKREGFVLSFFYLGIKPPLPLSAGAVNYFTVYPQNSRFSSIS